MKTVTITNYNNIYKDCYFVLSHYINNNNLAISIKSKVEGRLGNLTVNIESVKNGYAVIDTNNCDFAENLIEKYGLGNQVNCIKSGYCIYPIYKMDINKLLEYGIKVD